MLLPIITPIFLSTLFIIWIPKCSLMVIKEF